MCPGVKQGGWILVFALLSVMCIHRVPKRDESKRLETFVFLKPAQFHTALLAPAPRHAIISTPSQLQSCALHPERLLLHILVFLSWDRGCGPRPYPPRQAGVCRGRGRCFRGEKQRGSKELRHFMLRLTESWVTSGEIERQP